jgi:membrane protease YdiL (CAAX protease family)
MSRNSSNDTDTLTDEVRPRRSWRSWAIVLLLPLWVFVGFMVAQMLLIAIIDVLRAFHVPITSISASLLETILATAIYVIMIAIVIGLPWVVRKQRITSKDIGLQRLPLWRDILEAPAGLVVYLILSGILMVIVVALSPAFDVHQMQNTGFTGITQQYQLILAFITLVVISPIAEEIIFRGYLFGKLKKIAPVWVAVLVTSALFGLIHVAWNLAIDTFALSIVLCVLRLATGSIWASILLHMIKNGIAFYILFVNPILTSTIGG